MYDFKTHFSLCLSPLGATVGRITEPPLPRFNWPTLHMLVRGVAQTDVGIWPVSRPRALYFANVLVVVFVHFLAKHTPGISLDGWLIDQQK